MKWMPLAGCLVLSLFTHAAEEKVILDPAEGGKDFKIQGEYTAPAGVSEKWGAQVIAMGNRKFHASYFPGGLPGDGWNGKTRYESEGELDEGNDQILKFEGVDKVAWGNGHVPPPGVEIKQGLKGVLYELKDKDAKMSVTGPNNEGLGFVKMVCRSPTEGAKPAEGAIVLFDGSNVDAFSGAKIIEDGPWKGFMKEGGETKQKFTDYTLHVEFILPFKPEARLQGRGNSGVYNQHRYEVQVLDSFGLLGYDNECGGIYTKNPPLVNMCYPPLSWQTYDIEFKAARYKDGQRVSKAVITVKQNGVLIQDHFEVDGPTGGGNKENPVDDVQSGPLYLQEHHNPVAYRNVWIVENK